ncbi:hypothetical protein D3C75_891150 [compost metagenome]
MLYGCAAAFGRTWLHSIFHAPLCQGNRRNAQTHHRVQLPGRRNGGLGLRSQILYPECALCVPLRGQPQGYGEHYRRLCCGRTLRYSGLRHCAEPGRAEAPVYSEGGSSQRRTGAGGLQRAFCILLVEGSPGAGAAAAERSGQGRSRHTTLDP